MGRKAPAAATLALALVTSTGCGAALQATVGFSEEETRASTRSRRVRFEGLPANAAVSREDGEGLVPSLHPTYDVVEYDVEETVAVPKSRWPLYVGTGLDAVILGASVYAAGRVDAEDGTLAVYAVGSAVSALIADAIFSVVYSVDQEPTVVRFRPLETPPTTFVARANGVERRATLHPAWADAARFDFVADPDAAPGGPRLGLSPPPAPTPPLTPDLDAATPKPESEERWYGWQMIPADVLAIGGLIYGVAQQDERILVASSGLYLFSGPVAHLLHDRSSRAGGSFATRLFGPLAGAGTGAILGLFAIPALDCSNDDFGLCWLAGPAYGMAVGLGIMTLVSPILDQAFLAWEPVPPEDAAAPRLSLVPSMGVSDQGEPTFGLAGRF